MNGTTGNLTEVVATNVNATTANLTDCIAANNVNGTTGNYTEVVTTNVNATTVTATTLAGNLSANGVDTGANTVGFFNGTPATQPSAIANANNNVDNLASQLNSVIAALETLSLIAS